MAKLKNNKAANKVSDKARLERNENKKLAMRKLREALKNDPVKFEEAKKLERERYHKRKEQGKIKAISKLNLRDQRALRKDWRNRSKKSYDRKKKLKKELNNLETPPSSPALADPILLDATPGNHGHSTRSSAGKKRSRNNRKMLKLKIMHLKEKLKKERALKEKLKKQLYRKKKQKRDSPNSKVEEMVKGQRVSSALKQALLFGEVLSCQIKHNISNKTNRGEKRILVSSITGKVVKKYRFQKKLKSLVPTRLMYSKKPKKANILMNGVRTYIEKFYENDDSSRICPGKKETITYKKVKKQKRYLNYSLKDLYVKFRNSHPNIKISYAFFCKSRPFWVIFLNAKNRETCLCETHVNFQFVVSKLKYYNIIKENSSEEIIKSITCPAETKLKEICLKRECPDCKDKEVNIEDFDPNEDAKYEKWITKREELNVRGQQKICIKKVKQIICGTKQQLVLEFKNNLLKFLSHHFNMIHQYHQIKEIKQSLSEQDVLIHMDFSENYLCKYSEEVQSAHFGGSKPQITLHTVVTYQRAPEVVEPVTKSYCSLSKSLRHDPSAICAHLVPILKEIKNKCPNINEVHFLSDGPSTQYKNKKMFYFIMVLAEILNSSSVRWHYFESHHGKGAPDGIGGCVKRSADNIVARGQDISNYETLLDKLRVLKGIEIVPIDEADIVAFDSKLPKILPVFKGTMKVHEAVWSKTEPRMIRFRQLTCKDCSANNVCMHYSLGFNSYQEQIENTFESSEENSDSISSNFLGKESILFLVHLFLGINIYII